MTEENDSLKDIARELSSKKNVLILSHKSPDGDTLGSAFALYYGLNQLGKNAAVLCSDICPKKFSYLTSNMDINAETLKPDVIISVDIADLQLMGDKLSAYFDLVDICIDHHKTNTMSARLKYVDAASAATCEIIYLLLNELGVKITPQIADCLYTGICTDTGCFLTSNTTARTHTIAAELISAGANYSVINTELFDTKSKGRIEVERKVLGTMEYYCNDQVALCVISQELLKQADIDLSELDGVAAIPRQIQGVEVGITMKERLEGGYKISMRSKTRVDVAKVCAVLGGGGHVRAAGCTINKDLATAKKLLLTEVLKNFA